MVAQRPESSIRQCFSGRCGRFSGGQGKTGLGPRVSGHQRQSPACFLQARSHARLVYGENSRRHRWPTTVPTRRSPYWPDVQRWIAITADKSARDIRDRAILILLATYGLRSSEVSGLRLEDVNWESEKVSIGRSKQRRAQEYPLVSEAGEAILHYLQKTRPRCTQREIFLTSKAPFHRLSQGALYHLVSSRLSALGIHALRRGPHALRHACAGRLVTEGFSLKEVGDHLGHRSAFATRIYAKVDLAGLREAANFDLGGLR